MSTRCGFLRYALIALALAACSSVNPHAPQVAPNDGGTDGANGDVSLSAEVEAGVDTTVEAGLDASPPLPPPLEELRGVCKRAGGQLVSGECACPEQMIGGAKVRTNFDARAGGSCTRPNPGDPSCTVRGGFEHVLDAEGLAAVRACMTSPFYAFQRMNVRLRVPDAWTANEIRPIARWLDARLVAPSTFYAKLSAPPDTVDIVELLVGVTSIDVTDVASSFELPNIDPGNPNVAAATLHSIHVPSVDALDWALGKTFEGTRPSRNKAPAADAGAVGAAIERAIGETHLDVDGNLKIDTLLQRCIGLCDVTQTYTLPLDSGPVGAWRVRRYEGGVLYRETLAVGSPDRVRVDGWVMLDLGGEPSLIFRVDYAASRLKPTVLAYDRNWTPLGSFPFDLLPDASQAATAIATARPFGVGDTGVVLCDSGATFDDAALNAALIVGPNPVAVGSGHLGSLLGWVDAPADDAVGFLDGVRNTVLGIYLTEVFPKLHGKNMARLLVGQDGAPIRIVPRLLDRCLEGPGALDSIATNAAIAPKTRVVNVSGGDYFDAKACSLRFPDGLDRRFLWVTASGNSGRRSDATTPLARCPQSLPRRDNLIVVGATEQTNLWPLTDFGSTYADLGADCAGVTGACSGSSNSAPRVSRTAALIVKEHGANISNAMVRMAILLGVTVPATVLPFRSGGVHNHDDALRAARQLVLAGLGARTSLTAAEAQSALDALYPDHAVADQKRATLEQNGAFAP